MANKEDARSRPTVVLTLGRLPPALDIARSFAMRGWRVVVAEPFGMHLCRTSRAVDRSARVTSPQVSPERYLDDIVDIVAAERAKLVIPVSEETPRIAELRDRLPESVRLYAGSAATVRSLHDKYRFAGLAAAAGLPVAESLLPGTMPGQAPFDLVIKPRWSCSGRGLRFVEHGETIHAGPNDVIQRRVRGSEFSGFCVSIDGTMHAPVVYRAAVTSGSVAVCFERVDDQPGITDWMRAFALSQRYTGFLAFDFIVDAEGTPWALECNPRATSGIHFLQTGAIAKLVCRDTDEYGVYCDRALLAESWSCLSACLARVPRPAEFRRAMSCFIRARDVTWSVRDPLVFPLMPFTTLRIIRDAAVSGSTFAEVAVRDVEWREPAASTDALEPEA
jgi:predicted ATP-grasp superfamily ATP-dependent carboligase